MMRWFKKRKPLVVLIRVEGVIADGDQYGAGRAKVIAAIKEAERRGARAAVLRVNSPGGSVAACQEIFAALTRLRGKGIPLVASMGDVAASGGVYISMAADEIMANPGTVTGSIGVIIKSSDLSQLYDKVGVAAKVVKSGPHKDMLSTYRSFSQNEQELLQTVINDTHSQFMETVAAARGMDLEAVAKIADGRIFTGRQALQFGLVDSLGDLNHAVQRASTLAGLSEEPRLLAIQPRKGFLQRWLGFAAGQVPSAVWGSRLSGVPLWLMPTV